MAAKALLEHQLFSAYTEVVPVAKKRFSPLLTFLRVCGGSSPEAVFSGEKTFFPPYESGRDILKAWLEGEPSPLKAALISPEAVIVTRTGRRIRSRVKGPDGKFVTIEIVLGPAKDASQYDFRIATLYPISGNGVSPITDDGKISRAR
ncbi:hypothetical protein BFF98_00605 [Corynebacterium pseudotuberculosis]|nr:hypothetical protein ATN03_00125 [Corynebacterium pseudotuberculosis]AMN74893.1 hypothetical protein ATN05_00125 [Corynebacterium pseudotuberculosis]ANZ91052.1 hypothetical protein CPMB20_00125 [Corynebacterium pseudotuberculosis]ATB60923.1 Hypothetical protein BFF96_0027 [Corynebacterium pseudotuberculosis]ATD14493.1 hypothetical protein ATN04_10690 [Corynebacterium pseudotuberculosis]